MSYWSGYGVAPIEVRLRSLAQGYVRQASWQRIGGESPPWESFSQPPEPRCAASCGGRREAFKGQTTGQVLSCETRLIPRCRSRYSRREGSIVA